MVPVNPVCFSYYWASCHPSRAVCHFPGVPVLPTWRRKLKQPGEVPETSFLMGTLICAGLSESLSRLKPEATTMPLHISTASWIYTKPGLLQDAQNPCCEAWAFRMKIPTGQYPRFLAAGAFA